MFILTVFLYQHLHNAFVCSLQLPYISEKTSTGVKHSIKQLNLSQQMTSV